MYVCVVVRVMDVGCRIRDGVIVHCVVRGIVVPIVRGGDVVRDGRLQIRHLASEVCKFLRHNMHLIFHISHAFSKCIRSRSLGVYHFFVF